MITRVAVALLFLADEHVARYNARPATRGKRCTSRLRQPPSTVWPDESRASRAHSETGRAAPKDARRATDAGLWPVGLAGAVAAPRRYGTP
jgi:hypothetical protein